MTQDGVNKGRRRFLYIATGAMGAVGAVGVATPFVRSWFPSEKAKAIRAPVTVDISRLEPGEMRITEWRGKPIFIVRRTEEAIANLSSEELIDNLADPQSEVVSQQPEYAQNTVRSRSEDLLVIEGFVPTLAARHSLSRVSSLSLLMRTGRAVSFALATAPGSTWRGVFTEACQHQPIWSFRRI